MNLLRQFPLQFGPYIFLRRRVFIVCLVVGRASWPQNKCEYSWRILKICPGGGGVHGLYATVKTHYESLLQ